MGTAINAHRLARLSPVAKDFVHTPQLDHHHMIMATFPTLTMPGRPLTWLITGTSSGFGLSLARFAQASGHKVIASSRNPHKTPELKAEIESKGGKWIKLDVTDLASAKVVDDLEAGGDHIDVLVNNAGFAIFSPIETTTEKEACEQMDAMYFGPVRLIRGVLPYMRKRRFGVIVNISSGASLEGAPAMGIYAGAKGGLDGKFCTTLYNLANGQSHHKSSHKGGCVVQHPYIVCCPGDIQHQLQCCAHVRRGACAR